MDAKTKKTLMYVGIGVGVFLVARHLMNRGEKKSGVIGTSNAGNCSFYSGNVRISLPCGETIDNPASHWHGYSVECSGAGLGGCQVYNPQGVAVADGTTSYPARRKSFARF